MRINKLAVLPEGAGSTDDRLRKIQLKKEFSKDKKKVLKIYPGATTRKIANSYEVCDSHGMPIRKPELNLPRVNKTVREAWKHLAHAIWFEGMVKKSFNAFSDEKMTKEFSKVKEEE